MIDFSRFYRKNITCAGIGEVLFDVFDSDAKLGGAPANFAYHCRQNGLDAVVISSVGNDDLGFKARDILASRFVPALLVQNDRPTGTVTVKVDDKGVPCYVFADNTAYDNIEFTSEIAYLSSKLDVVCFGTLAQRNTVSKNTVMSFLDALKPQALKVYDVNLRGNFYSRDILEQSLKRCDVFKCNEDELPALCSILDLNVQTHIDFNSYLADRGIDCFIYTQGSEQSTVYLNGNSSCLATPSVAVVDTVGAGDSFTATLICSLIKGAPLHKAHQKAVEVAAFVCTQKGAMPDIPLSYFDAFI